jgi:hypothetical protein
MAILRWEWTLANRGSVEAVLDTTAARETVRQNGRVLSEGARGAKPDGHTVLVSPDTSGDGSERPPLEAVVTFSPTAAICILRVEGHEMAPKAWPVRERPTPPKVETSWAKYALAAGAIAILVAAGIAGRSLVGSSSTPAPRVEGKLDGTHRAMNGLFVAHHPPDLEPRLAVLPNGVSGVVLEDKPKTLAIVLAAQRLEAGAPHDGWVLQQRLSGEALANLNKGAGKYEETVRRDETCLGKPGAVTLGQVKHGSTRVARIWSCAFVHEDAGYFFLTMLAEPAGTADERYVRSIVDATELTTLADLGDVPTAASSDPRLDRPQ